MCVESQTFFFFSLILRSLSQHSSWISKVGNLTMQIALSPQCPEPGETARGTRLTWRYVHICARTHTVCVNCRIIIEMLHIFTLSLILLLTYSYLYTCTKLCLFLLSRASAGPWPGFGFRLLDILFFTNVETITWLDVSLVSWLPLGNRSLLGLGVRAVVMDTLQLSGRLPPSPLHKNWP